MPHRIRDELVLGLLAKQGALNAVELQVAERLEGVVIATSMAADEDNPDPMGN